MRIINLFLLFSLVVLFSSCDKDKEGSLTLHFVAHANGNPVPMFETQNGIGNDPLQFGHLSMIVSDLKLLDSGGEEYLKDVELVNLSFDDPTSAAEGYVVHIDGIPAKTYDGISLGIGVPPDVNDDVPADFPSSNPLSNAGYYWQAWQSYIFMKVEGRLDTASPGSFETNFAYHTGSNDLYRILESSFPLTINDGEDTELTIVFDYALILEGIDIAANPQNHDPGDTIQINRIVNNLQSAVTLFQ